ncbi:hypothetical protein PS3A_18020 [Pseudomonas sp. 3A(2025)]
MSTPLQPVITKSGLAAIFTADNTGIAAKIGSVVLGTAGYEPDADQKSLVNQVAEYKISGGERLSSTLLHITALADDDKAYWAREIGFKLTTGQLLAVWSHPTEALTYKAANASILLAYDLSLVALPADSVTIVSNEAGLSLSLAAPLAALASSLLSEQLRGLQHNDQFTELERQQRLVGDLTTRRLDDLAERLVVAEQRNEGLLSMGISAVEAVLSAQLRGLDLQDQITLLSRQLVIAVEQAARQDVRLTTAEQRQAIDHEGVRSMGIAVAEAVITAQTQLFKNTGA